MPKELPNRRLWFATAATATLVVGSTLVAGAAVLDLPVFGFGQHADASGSNTTETTRAHKVEPVPVEQIQFDDQFVRRGGTANQGPDDQNESVDPTVEPRPDDSDSDGTGDIDSDDDSDDGEEHQDEGEAEVGHEIGDDN